MKKIMVKDADILVILLHGLGSSAENFADIAYAMSTDLPKASFYVPNAFENYFGQESFQWFDLGDREPSFVATQIHKAYKKLNQELDRILAEFNVTDNRLILGGFSQGAMMSLYTAPRREKECLGVCAFSGAMIAPSRLADDIKSKPHTCIIHGKDDEVVPFWNYGVVCNTLSENKIPFVGHQIAGLGHFITNREIDLATKFIRERMQSSV